MMARISFTTAMVSDPNAHVPRWYRHTVHMLVRTVQELIEFRRSTVKYHFETAMAIIMSPSATMKLAVHHRMNSRNHPQHAVKSSYSYTRMVTSTSPSLYGTDTFRVPMFPVLARWIEKTAQTHQNARNPPYCNIGIRNNDTMLLRAEPACWTHVVAN
jgi:hypothetical protein